MNDRILTLPMAALMLIGALLTGCATPSKPEAMVAALATPVHRSKQSVAVQVQGGKATSSAGASQISSDDFARALRESIQKAGLFASVADGGAARYRLDAFIGQLDQPMFGFSLTVKLEVEYTLVDTQSNQSVWRKSVVGEHTAGASEAFAATTRLRLANEGAARQNIQKMIEEVSALKLD